MSETIKYCTAREAAKIIGCTYSTILNMVRDQRIRGKQFGSKKNSQIFIERESLESWTK